MFAVSDKAQTLLTNYVGNLSGLPSYLIRVLLNNQNGPGTNNTRYRFVWMDGCNTANGDWPDTFAMGKQENKALIDYTVRPSVFCGFNAVYTFATGTNVVPEVAYYRSEFAFNWSQRGMTVYMAHFQAGLSSGWSPGNTLKLYGYWDLHWKEYNTKIEWP